MLPDVGMVQMYSKSANVNDLHGFCVDRLAPLFAWTGPPPCSYGFSASWFAMPFRGTLHHPYICPCFWRKNFYTPLFLEFLWNANCTWTTADLLERLPNNSGNKGMCSKCMAGCVAHCGMWLGGQPRVVCGGSNVGRSISSMYPGTVV